MPVILSLMKYLVTFPTTIIKRCSLLGPDSVKGWDHGRAFHLE